MKIKLITVFFAILIFIIFPVSTSAQSLPIGLSVPGVDCGVASGSKGIDKCCYNKPVSISKLPDWIPDINNVKTDFNKKADEYNNLQTSTQTPCVFGAPDPAVTDYSSPSCKCVLTISPTVLPVIGRLCDKYLSGNNEHQACINCANSGGLYTGFACVPTALNSFISDFLLGIGIGFAGLIALGCIIYSAIMIQTSAGNPEKIKKAQENLTSCIIGLILIIFSVFLLRLIGVTILRIPFFK